MSCKLQSFVEMTRFVDQFLFNILSSLSGARLESAKRWAEAGSVEHSAWRGRGGAAAGRQHTAHCLTRRHPMCCLQNECHSDSCNTFVSFQIVCLDNEESCYGNVL